MSGPTGHRKAGTTHGLRTGTSLLVASVFAAALAAVPVCRADDPAGSGRGVAPATASGQEWFRENPPARVDDPALPPSAPQGASRAADRSHNEPGQRAPQNNSPFGGGWQWSPPSYGAPGNGGYGNGGGYGGFPTYEMNNFVVAQVRAATARALFNRAEGELSGAFRDAQRHFDRSPELRAALRDEQAAYDALNDVRRRAVNALLDDPKYQRLLALKQDLADQLEQRRAARDITPNEVLAMANLKMSYAVDLRAMEGNALNNEPGLKDATDRLVTAGSRVADLRARHDDAVRTSPDIMMARRNLEDARIARVTAETFLRATGYAGGYALDYAYNYRPRGGYYGYAGGGGYGGY